MNLEFLLDSEELAWVQQKRNNKNRLAAAVTLKFFQTEGYYPEDDDLVSQEMIMSIAKQLDVSAELSEFLDADSRTSERYRQEIRKLLNYKSATLSDGKELVKYLQTTPSLLVLTAAQRLEEARKFFKLHKLEPLKIKEIKKYVATAVFKVESELLNNISTSLSKETIKIFDKLLEADGNEDNNINDQIDSKKSDISKLDSNNKEGLFPLWQLKKDLSGPKLKNVQIGIDKLCELRNIALPNALLGTHNRKILHKYYLRVMALSPSNILEYKPDTRYALTASFCYIRTQILTDSLADLLLKLIRRMRSSAETSVNKDIISDVKCINGKFDILHSLAKISITHPDSIIKNKIYPEISQETLDALVKELQSKGRWYQTKVQNKIKSLYSHGTRVLLLKLIDVFDFRSHNNDGNHLLEALKFIKCNSDVDSKYYPDITKGPVDQVLSSQWKDAIIEQSPDGNKVNRFNYEIAILEELYNKLDCKLIWIKESYRYRDPEEDVPSDFEERKEYYYGLLGLPLCAKEFLNQNRGKTNKHLEDLNRSIINNPKVKILDTKDGGRIKITPSEPQEEPLNIKLLQQAINQRFSTINLIDVLKEVDLILDFTSKLQTVGFKSAIEREALRKRILLCLYALGSNAGLKRISAANDNVNHSDLRYIKRKYINTANIKEAIVDVVNAILEIRDPKIWSIATTGVACDSTQVSSWDQNLLSQWHPRYKEHGVMIYWHVDMGSTCIYSQLKTCTSSEVGSMINGILNHCTKMEVKQSYVDTHGQSVIGFGFSNLLKFDLLPRLKKINRQKLYYFGKSKNLYRNIEPILAGSINEKLIEENYHQAVKYAVALKICSVEPDVLIRQLSSHNGNNPAYKALIEIGKIQKTTFLCRYISSEDLRIEIHSALNIVERLNSIMHFIFYGKLGRLSSNNKEEQELSVVCLHLLQVCMVYINTIIIQEILSEPFWVNKLSTEDKRALTPLMHSHINPYGLFPLDLTQRLIITAPHKQRGYRYG
jgi:TnpA family transposase